MATLTLPTLTGGTPHYSFRVSLDGGEYTLELHWNGRLEAWFLDITDVDGTVLESGIRVVVGWPLLARAVNEDMPPGQLVAVDTSGQDAEATLNDLGGRVQLVYTEAADLP